MTESHFLGRLIGSLGVPKEREVWNTQGGRKDKHISAATERAEARWLQQTTQKHGREELPLPKVRGGNQEHQAATAQERCRGASPCLRSGEAAKRNFPKSEVRNGGPGGATTHPRSGAMPKRSYSMFKVRRGGPEKIPLIQDKEQWLRFAGAAVKRCSTSKVREFQVRW